MPRGKRNDTPIERQHLHLRSGDFAELARLFPALGPSAAARKIISNFIDRVRATQAPLDIDLTHSDLEELIPNE